MSSQGNRSSLRWSSAQSSVLLALLMRWQTRSSNEERAALQRAWVRWRKVDELRKEEVSEQRRENLKRESLRLLQQKPPGTRSDNDCRIIGKWLQTLACVPKLENKALLQLAHSIEMLQCPANMLILLQGEFGNCYYMIAFGAVALYVEDNRDHELANFRDLAEYRGKALPVPRETLGRFVLTLPEGKGFGELAVIATTHKIRSASAVSAGDTCLLVVQGPVYLATIHPVSKAQDRVGMAMSLLRQHPLVKSLSFANVAALAYEMQNLTRQRREVIVRAGQMFNNLYVVGAGFVKAHDERNVGAALLGRGCIIGECELHNNLPAFTLTYTAETVVEVYELPLTMYLKVLRRAQPQTPGQLRATISVLHARQHRIERAREQIERLSARRDNDDDRQQQQHERRYHRNRAHTIASIVPFLRLPQRPTTPTTTPRSKRSPRTPRTLHLASRSATSPAMTVRSARTP